MAVPKLERQRWAPKRYDYHYNFSFCLAAIEVSLDSAVDEETYINFYGWTKLLIHVVKIEEKVLFCCEEKQLFQSVRVREKS